MKPQRRMTTRLMYASTRTERLTSSSSVENKSLSRTLYTIIITTCHCFNQHLVSISFAQRSLSDYRKSEAVLAIRPGRPWPTQTARVIPMIPTYTIPVGLPKICLAFDWPTQMKIPRTAPSGNAASRAELRCWLQPKAAWLQPVADGY